MTTIHLNKIPIEKRVILHKNKAFTLISFDKSDPSEINDWFQRGEAPVLWDPDSWKVVEHTKWKIERDEEGGIVHVEAMDL